MRADDFRAACQILWGQPGVQWGAKGAAEHLKVNERNVYYWGAGTKPVPAGVEEDIRAEMQRRLEDPADQTPGLAALKSAHQRVEAGTRAA